MALLLAPGRALGGAAPNFVWQAPQGCPSPETVRALIANWLGQTGGELELGAVSVAARVRAEGDGFVLDMTLKSPAGSDREQHAARRCETLSKIVALKVALAVDPVAALEAAEPKASRRPRLLSPTPERTLAGALRAAGGVALGPLPGVAPTISLTGSLIWPDFRGELGLGYRFRRTVTYDALPGVGAELEMLAATGRVCPTATLGRIEIPLCVGVEGGIVRAEGFGVADAKTSDRPWVALVIGPALTVPLFAGVYVWLEADAGFGIVLPSFRVRNLPRLYQAESGAAQAVAGLELRFP